jgi:hypothetical protein
MPAVNGACFVHVKDGSDLPRKGNAARIGLIVGAVSLLLPACDRVVKLNFIKAVAAVQAKWALACIAAGA